MTDLLTVSGLRAGYAGGTVLDGVDLTVPAGSVVALLGRNGVGKTTFVHTVMGMLRPYSGSVRLGGRELAGAPAHVVARAGAAIVPQGRRVFAPLTVEENLQIAAPRRGGPWTVERVYELMPRLAERRANRGDQLSGGEQQMLAIGRALMSRPKLLLLDEPSLGLAPLIVQQIFKVIRDLNREQGLTVFLVEQNAYHALKIAHRAYVMVNGLITMSGPASELLRSEEIKSAYLEGGAHA